MEYVAASRVSLRTHPGLNEQWLHDQIRRDPGLLGLGDLDVLDTERGQPRAGRLDLLLRDPSTRTRYEVEIQLGATDPSHIIRTIEYWDIERTRYPSHEHVAVLAAEDITSRFLNVIRLFNAAIPIVAIQLAALQVGERLTLHATTVLDLTHLLRAEDEEEPGAPTDRGYWEAQSSPGSMALLDRALQLVREGVGDPTIAPKYNKYYVGIVRGGVSDNFITFRARKGAWVLAEFRLHRTEELVARLEDANMAPLMRRGPDRLRIRLTEGDLANNRELLTELIRSSASLPPPPTDD